MAAEKMQLYKCEVCGNIVQVLHGGAGSLVCCDQEMKLIVESSYEVAAREKHVPVIERTDSGIKVIVGSIHHPMEEKHYIEWIELLVGDKVCRRFLKPGDVPEAFFPITDEQVTARAYCNLHGLWKSIDMSLS